MPRISGAADLTRRTPSLQTGGVSVGDSPLDSAERQLTQSLLQSGSVISEIAELEAERLDRTKIDDGLNKLQSDVLEYSHGEDGYTGVTGEGVVTPEYREKYEGLIQASVEAGASGMVNERQKRLYKEQSDRIMLSFKSGLMQHGANQIQKYEKDVFDSGVALKIKTAEINFLDSDIVSGVADSIRDQVKQYGDEHGWSEDIKASKLIKVLGPMHSTVVQQLITAGEFDQAEQHLEDNINTIGVGNKTVFTKAIKENRDIHEVDTKTAEFLTTTTDLSTKNAMSWAGKNITDPKQRKKVVANIKAYNTAVKEQQKIEWAENEQKLIENSVAGTLTDSMIVNAYIDPKRKRPWVEYNGKKKTTKIVSDVGVRGDLRRRINQTPESVTSDEIWDEVTAGKLTDSDAQTLENKRVELLKPEKRQVSANLKRAHQILDRARKDEKFTELEWSEEADVLDDFANENPDADLTTYMKTRLEPVETGFWARKADWFLPKSKEFSTRDEHERKRRQFILDASALPKNKGVSAEQLGEYYDANPD